MKVVDINSSLSDYLQSVSLKLHKIMVWAAIVCVMGFSFLDYYLARDHYLELLMVRTISTVFCVASMILQKKFQLKSEFIAYTCCLSVFLFVEYLCMRVPSNTVFLYHINSCAALLGYSAIVLWHWKHYLITYVICFVFYALFFILFRQSSMSLIDTIINGGVVFWIVFTLSLLFSAYRYQSVCNEFELRYELALSNKDILDKNEELQIKQEEIATQNEELYQQQEEIIAQRDALQDAYHEIHRKNEDILASINYARRIQKALLPSKEEIDAIFPQNFVLFRPRDIVSGDFYWCIEKDGRKFIAVADCTGHGIPGAFMSMIGVEMLNEIVVSKDIMEADKILNKLNLSIGKALRQDEGENKDGMDIALCVFHPTASQLEYAGAMNPIIYIKNDEITELKATKKGVGGHQLRNTDFQGYQKQTIPIQTPTMLYLFSDGFQDQFGGKDGRKFMIKNLRQLFLEIYTKPMQEQRQILKDAIMNWMGERHKQIDDILVIGVKL